MSLPKKEKRILIGIAAMEKKARSKPMMEIMRRFDPKLFEFVIFGDEVLLNSAVADWPIVDYLFAWYSNNYPLDKANDYVKLRNVPCINDVNIQHQLMDRRRVYAILQEVGINVPRHVILNEEDRAIPGAVIECDDWIEVKGQRFNKPVVEKPVNAEDHNVYIYYPLSAGGGSKRLFRKVGSKSSQFYPDVNEFRKEGSYIIEEFINTQGVDVKVYTVGPNYGHAEARKSPVIDGKVIRNKDGSETRYPVLLSAQEKLFANKVVMAFKQGVCGFDILRVHGKSYVCDVNGWSFVKTSSKYFDDCAQLLSEIVRSSVTHKCLESLSAVGPYRLTSRHASLQDLSIEPHQTQSKAKPRRKRRFSLPIMSGEQPRPTSFKVTVNTSENIDENVDLEDDSSRQNMGINQPDTSSSASSPTRDLDKGHLEGEELRCVICVLRHGDRTPKQKLKFVIERGDDCGDGSGLLCPFFAFFHAFLDADVAAEKIYKEKRQMFSSDHAVKGGLAAALSGVKDGGNNGRVTNPDLNIDNKPPPGSTAAAVAAVAKVLDLSENSTNVGTTRIDNVTNPLNGDGTVMSHRTNSQEFIEAALEVASSSLAEKLSNASGGETNSNEKNREGSNQLKRSGNSTTSLLLDSSVPLSPSTPVPLKSLETLFDVEDLKPSTHDGVILQSDSSSDLSSLKHPTFCEKQECHHVKHVAPKKKEVKVRSKEGLKSFLLTTESVMATLLRATKDAKDKHEDVKNIEGGEEEQLPDVLGMKGEVAETLLFNLLRVQDVLNRRQVNGISGKLQLKALSWAPVNLETNETGIVSMKATKIEVVLKWGGALTPLGEAQAEYLGETLRKSLYPDPEGGGVLRLHSTFRHDLKIRTSDEGRVMQTAASFAKGLLQLEGPLTPILVSLVRKEKGSLHMLDHTGNDKVKHALEKCKKELSRLLHIPGPLSVKRLDELAPDTGNASVRNSLNIISNPIETLKRLYDAVGLFVMELDKLLIQAAKDDTTTNELYMRESILLLVHRWRKLYKDFYKPKKADFDLSKVPDILDAIRYDLEHNKAKLAVKKGTMEKIYRVARELGKAYVPQEYGIGSRTKLLIGTRMCCELLKKIRNDLILGTQGNEGSDGGKADMHYMLDTSHADNLDVKSLGRHVRTRLYFTSETHLHTLLNVLRYGHLKLPGFPNHHNLKPVIDEEGESFLSNQAELCYLTHIVIRVFENMDMSRDDPSRFRVELSFSPGANRDPINLTNDCNDFNMEEQCYSPVNKDKSGGGGNDSFDLFPTSNIEPSSSLKKSYFENNPSDADQDESRLRIAKAQPLNFSTPSTVADLEQFLEVAIDIAESPIDFQTPLLSSQNDTTIINDELMKNGEDGEDGEPFSLAGRTIPPVDENTISTWLFRGAVIGIAVFAISKVMSIKR